MLLFNPTIILILFLILRLNMSTTSAATHSTTSISTPSSCAPLMPATFVCHGGGPMPLLGSQEDIASFLSNYAKTLPSVPSAVLVVTAHWIESDAIAVSSGPTHPLMFDYGGFPEESYKYKYNAPGNPALASEICKLLKDSGINCKEDRKRGWDHGVFVPLMLLYPQANVPIVAMSLHASLDPALHLRIGRAIAPLREKGVLILGSGASFHNFDYYFTGDMKKRKEGIRHSHIFSSFLEETLTSGKLSVAEQMDRLVNIKDAPSAAHANKPRQEEHLIPLHVVAGAGMALGGSVSAAEGPGNGRGSGCRVVGPKYGIDSFSTINLEWR